VRPQQEWLEALDPPVLLQLPPLFGGLRKHLERELLATAHHLTPPEEYCVSSHDCPSRRLANSATLSGGAWSVVKDWPPPLAWSGAGR
jgi:hypothetical protein